MGKDPLLCGRQMMALCIQVPLVYRNTVLSAAVVWVHTASCIYLTYPA